MPERLPMVSSQPMTRHWERAEAGAGPASRYWPLLTLAVLVLLAACGGDPGTGPVDVKWDRAACDRCRMVLSDRNHSAQVRVREADGRSRVHLFDDVGCAVIWLEDNPLRDDPATEIWVNDWRDGGWIDARTASYVTGQETPMQYGLGAQSGHVEGALDFEGAKAHIFEVERRYNVHGGHLDGVPSEHRHE